MKAFFVSSLLIFCGLSWSPLGFTQGVDSEKKEPTKEESESRGDGERRRGDREDRFRGLSLEDREKIRNAFDKVWVRPEVKKAREDLRVANEAYRMAIEEALKAVDPEAAALLEKTRPTPPHHQFPLAQTAPANREEATLQASLQEIQSSLATLLEKGRKREGSDQHLRAEEIHPKILENEKVKAALEAFKVSSEEQAKEKWEQFRIAYLDSLASFLPRRGFPFHSRGSRGRDESRNSLGSAAP